ncbi:hypothetical protein PPL_00809 [Heterostelium album PN500]|uniref:Uncharacterized protein n=1 Tax=Heterostelium pallidum (strain ATCC 26659 / Pp 5 / PN500) TaxID=670386 RepID=D3AXH8_HETP5|nr:hypothetical protein PPL_00809 [Heterostelium album PN500]EFA86247.1 hypothetical protein PPL_00809 [Heterostelium album PN500]|eukprot:XP_020438352.1 hypothetical protein PPL_00809 [Heterostelium album PN500]
MNVALFFLHFQNKTTKKSNNSLKYISNKPYIIICIVCTLDKPSSSFYFIDLAHLVNSLCSSDTGDTDQINVVSLSKLCEDWMIFMEASPWVDEVYGQKTGLELYSFDIGNQYFTNQILKLSKENNFYFEKIHNILNGNPYYQSDQGVKPTHGFVVIDTNEKVVAFCFITRYPTQDIYIDYVFVCSTQGKQIGANLFCSVVESLQPRPKVIFIESKISPQAEHFWFNKIQFTPEEDNEGQKFLKIADRSNFQLIK